MKPRQTERAWYALYVRSRFEKIVALNIQRKGYEEYLPLRGSPSVSFKGTGDVNQPLFPGYVFCKFDYPAESSILMIPGVLSAVGVGRASFSVPEEEIFAVKSIVASTLIYNPWAYVDAGELMRVEYGPLAGLEGFVVQVEGNHRLIVSVNLLRRSVGVAVDRASLKPALISTFLAARPAG